MTNPITKDTPDFEAVVLEAGLKHHCLSCDSTYCPSYEELPASQRGFRDIALPAILAAHNQAVEAAVREARNRAFSEATQVINGLMAKEVLAQLKLQTPTNQKGGE